MKSPKKLAVKSNHSPVKETSIKIKEEITDDILNNDDFQDLPQKTNNTRIKNTSIQLGSDNSKGNTKIKKPITEIEYAGSSKPVTTNSTFDVKKSLKQHFCDIDTNLVTVPKRKSIRIKTNKTDGKMNNEKIKRKK